MKASTISELKKELKLRHPDQVIEFCVRIAKHKKENKELLTYLLFESDNEFSYVESVKNEIDEQFKTLNRSNIYLIKKTVRKVLNMTKKYIRYSANKQTEVELLIYFCKKLKELEIPIKRSRILNNIYDRQVFNISKALATLHEDLQFDYNEDLAELIK